MDPKVVQKIHITIDKVGMTSQFFKNVVAQPKKAKKIVYP